MGTYVDSTDIPKYYNNKKFTTTTTITIIEVDAFITIQEAYVDSTLSSLYVLPLTEDQDKNLIKKVVEFLVACSLDGVYREGMDTESKTFNYKRNLCKTAESLLDMIRSKKLRLKATVVDNQPIIFNKIGSNGVAVTPFFTDAKANPDNWDNSVCSSDPCGCRSLEN